MTKKRFPWDCGNCRLLIKGKVNINDLGYRCLWSGALIKHSENPKSKDCPMEEHDKQIRAKAIDDCIAFVKEHSHRHYVDCDRFSGEMEEIFRLDVWQDEFEMLKEKTNERVDSKRIFQHQESNDKALSDKVFRLSFINQSQ